MNRLKEISEPYNCFILEDAAHALESIDDANKIEILIMQQLFHLC